MKISYLIGLYNKEKYIIECIDSILDEKDESFEIEICIVDDGSTDNSKKIVIDHYGLISNINFFSFEENRGKNAAYNKAYEMCTGDFICIFGADDSVVSGRTKKMVDYALKTNKAVYGSLIAYNEDLTKEIKKIIVKKPSLYEISMQNSLGGGACLIPKEICQEIFPIPENLKFEDWWVGYILIINEKVEILSEYVTKYRMGSNNDVISLEDDLYFTAKKDYLRTLDYIKELRLIKENIFLEKSLDLRLAFFKKSPNKLFYFHPFDKYSIKIIIFNFIGASVFYKLLSKIRLIKKLYLNFKLILTSK